ncbi:Clp protease N-terminal domain-containing protein, partial [Streptomyces sp. NPDC004050]
PAANTANRPDHLDRGLLAEDEGLAVLALRSQGVAPDAVRAAATATLPPATDGTVPDLVPFDASAKKALELTFREALRLGHDYVGTEHILLALLELEHGEGVLSGLGLEKPTVEAAVSDALAAVLGPDGGKEE